MYIDPNQRVSKMRNYGKEQLTQLNSRMNKRTKQILGAAVVLVVIFFGYEFLIKAPVTPPAPQPTPVSIAEVIERKVQLYNEFSGRLDAVDQVEIRPRIGGAIESVNFQEGTYVKKGDVLFIIDQRPYIAAVGKAEAELASAQAQESLAKTDMDRAKKLIAGKAIPQKEFDQRSNNLKLADANLKTAEAGLTIAKLNLEYSLVKAPIAGRISRAEVTTGNLVDAGGNAPLLTTIVSSDPIYADFEIDEQTYLTYTKVRSNGNSSKVPVMMGLTGEAGTPHKGEIISFDNQLERNSGTIRVRAVFDNKNGNLVPGLFVHMRLGSSAKAKVILVTDRAIGTDQSKKFVLVVGSDNKVERRDVKLGQEYEGLRVVEEGLKPGEKIIVSGLQRARPDSVVTPETVPMDDSPAVSEKKSVTAEPVSNSDETEDVEENDNNSDNSFEENNSAYDPSTKTEVTKPQEKDDDDFEESNSAQSPAEKTEDIKLKDVKDKGLKKPGGDDANGDGE